MIKMMYIHDHKLDFIIQDIMQSEIMKTSKNNWAPLARLTLYLRSMAELMIFSSCPILNFLRTETDS